MRKILTNALLDNFGKYSYQNKFSEGYQYYMILYYKIMINEHWNPLSALGKKKLIFFGILNYVDVEYVFSKIKEMWYRSYLTIFILFYL